MGADFFRRADWLDKRARGYLLLLALTNVATLAFLIATSRGGIDRNGFLLGTDFLSFWTSGKMLLAGGDVYDTAAHITEQRRFFAADSAYTAFFYPPVFLFFCAPLGPLGYFPALVAWLAATGAAFVAAVRGWARGLALPLPGWIVLAAFPPALITVTHGQSAFLVSALLGLGALWVRERPMLAGVMFGLATVKPQFGFLIPLVLVLTGEWRTIASASITAGVLAMLATVAFGPDIWMRWLAIGGAVQAAMTDGAVPFGKMTSLYAGARLLGIAAGPAFALQGILTLAVAGGLAWACLRRRRFDAALASATLVGALLTTPFVLDYDMVLLAFPLLHLAASGFGPWEKSAAALAFIAPIFARPLALAVGLPIMPLVLGALFVVLLRRSGQIPAPAGGLPARG